MTILTSGRHSLDVRFTSDDETEVYAALYFDDEMVGRYQWYGNETPSMAIDTAIKDRHDVITKLLTREFKKTGHGSR